MDLSKGGEALITKVTDTYIYDQYSCDECKKTIDDWELLRDEHECYICDKHLCSRCRIGLLADYQSYYNRGFRMVCKKCNEGITHWNELIDQQKAFLEQTKKDYESFLDQRFNKLQELRGQR